MSNFVLVGHLKQLQQLQQQKITLQESIKQITQQIDEQHRQQQQLIAAHKDEHLALLQLQKAVATSQEELTALTSQERLRREQLEQEHRSEAIYALSATVKQLEHSRRELESKLEKLWQDMEKRKRAAALLEQQANNKTLQTNETLAQLAAQQQAHTAQIPAIEQQMVDLLGLLPEEIRLHLVSMNQKANLLAITKIIDNVCGGCFYPLSNRDLALLQQHQEDFILACKNCFTLLYLENDVTA